MHEQYATAPLFLAIAGRQKPRERSLLFPIVPFKKRGLMGYTLKIDDLSPLTIGAAIEKIISSPKRQLEDLRLFDMLLDENMDAESALRHGVYLFFDEDNTCIYVGMCSSSHFAHRIGGHFGMSPKYGMNTFLRRAVRDMGLSEKEYGSYVKSLRKIGKYSLLIISANNVGKKSIRALERLLHIAIRPRLNFPQGFPETYLSIESETNFQDGLVICGALV
jgi:hypothetical protein